MQCSHPVDPAALERVVKPFCIRLDWPGSKPLAYTMQREDVAHCLMHLDEVQQWPSEVLKADIRQMLSKCRPDHGLIVQALFYLCTLDPVYQAAGGVPTVDFARVRAAPHGWAIQFGRQEPGPMNVRMIRAISGASQ